MLAALMRTDAVYKRDLDKLVCRREPHSVFPTSAFAVTDSRPTFVNTLRLRLVGILHTQIEVDILLEVLDGNWRSIIQDLNLFDRLVSNRADIEHALLEQS